MVEAGGACNMGADMNMNTLTMAILTIDIFIVSSEAYMEVAMLSLIVGVNDINTKKIFTLVMTLTGMCDEHVFSQ